MGAENIDIEAEAKTMSVDGHVVREGDWITLDGGDGSVYSGQMALIRPEPPKAYEVVMKWADKHRKMSVRANADTPQDARRPAKWARKASDCAEQSICFSRISNIPKTAGSANSRSRK